MVRQYVIGGIAPAVLNEVGARQYVSPGGVIDESVIFTGTGSGTMASPGAGGSGTLDESGTGSGTIASPRAGGSGTLDESGTGAGTVTGPGGSGTGASHKPIASVQVSVSSGQAFVEITSAA